MQQQQVIFQPTNFSFKASGGYTDSNKKLQCPDEPQTAQKKNNQPYSKDLNNVESFNHRERNRSEQRDKDTDSHNERVCLIHVF